MQGGAFWHIYELFGGQEGHSAVHLPALVAQLPTLAAMFFVCAFGSCLDVAAIQADMEDPIDFDAELTTAGAEMDLPVFEESIHSPRNSKRGKCKQAQI